MIKAEIKGEIYDLQYVAETIRTAQEDVEITINSPGGSAIEGMNVARAIVGNRGISVIANVETMAASAAAVIALSCEKVRMSKMDILVLHHCWTVAIGNKEDLEQEIDAMKHIDAILEEYLTNHCKDNEKAEELKQRMADGDVYLNAEEAADLFDNVEVVEMPKKEEMQNCVNLAKLVEEKKAALKEVAELKAKLAELQAEEKEEEPEEEEKPEEKEEEPQAQYSAEVMAIINEVL